MLNLFIALTDRDKRLLFILFLLIIVVIAFLAIIGAIITRVMRWQGKKLDNITHDVVITGVVNNRKEFISYARKKNWRLFFLQSWKPLLIMLIVSLVLIVRNMATNDWGYNLLDYKVTGFNTLFFVWDYGDPSIYHKFFGITLICDWPPIINYPHFMIEAWASYVFFFGMMIGGIWYLVSVQRVIARAMRMYKLSYQLFNKSLDNYNTYDALKNAINPNSVNVNNNEPPKVQEDKNIKG